MSLGSWNKLESLLLDATTKPTASTTPKTIPKLDEVTHPHLLRCVRHKKSLKFSRGPMRSGEFIASCKEISANDSGIIPSKVKLGVSKTYTAIRDTPMPKSTVGLENCDEYSQEEREVSIEMNNEEYEENEEEPAENYQNNHRIGSLDMELIYRDGRATEAAQRKMQELARHASMDETLAMKTYKPVCGIEDHHLRELYRLTLSHSKDLKIGSFADSEESFLTGTKKKSSGFKLSFLESGFGPRAIEKLGQIIRDNSEITQLVLRKSVLTGTNIRSFARNLSLMPSLIHLELANNSMEPQDFAILFEELANSKTLISIDISNYEPDKKNRFTMECLPAFRKFVQGSVYLQYVTMVSLMLEDELMQELLATLEQCPNLLSLNVASNNSSGKALERLTNVISQTSICHLDLSHNKLKREGAQHLAKAIQNLKGPGREGVNLVLENTHLGIDVNYIFAAFGRDTNVAKLNLGQNFLCGLEIIRLESALSEGSKLQELNFSNCKLGEIGGKILALGLSKNSWLQSLILVNNDLGDSIAAGIIHAVTHNHSLRQLDLSQNKLASESAKALQDLIKKNPNVEKYNLHLNKINEKEGYLLQEALYFNSKIIQFNIHHNPVKYNTIETVERIVKDNLKKLRFHAVPKLKTEVAKKRVFIQDEKHNVSQAIEMEKVKGEVKRDVDKFQKTLTALRNRSESPTIKKNEKLIMKLGKDIKAYNVEQNDAIIEVREFGNEACLERDMYKNEIDNIAVNIKQVSNKVDEKRKDIEDVKEKYEPEIRKLRLEINRLKKDNQFLELYNETITKKIKKEKKKAALSSRLPNPKISDIFLASSELARHKRKNPEIQDTTHNQLSRSRLGVVMETHSEISHTTDNSKIKREYNFAMKNQQFRISKVMKENERGQSQKKKKKTAPKGDGSELDVMKQRIKEKIKNLIKVNETPDNILGQIADNEQQQQPLQV